MVKTYVSLLEHVHNMRGRTQPHFTTEVISIDNCKYQRKRLTAHVQPSAGQAGMAAGTEYDVTRFQGVLRILMRA
jgi:hypothetical protein